MQNPVEIYHLFLFKYFLKKKTDREIMLAIIIYRWIHWHLMKINEPLSALDASRIAISVFELYVRITSWQRLQVVSSFNPSSYVLNSVTCNDVGYFVACCCLAQCKAHETQLIPLRRRNIADCKYRWCLFHIVVSRLAPKLAQSICVAQRTW